MESIRIKLNYIIIIVLSSITMLLGRFFTILGMNWYYTELVRPSWTPPSITFAIAWMVIFLLTTWCVLIVWNNHKKDAHFWSCMFLFILNAILNVFWTYTFFYKHAIGTAIFVAGALELTLAALILSLWQRSTLTAFMLLPYFAWVAFALYLNYAVYLLN